MQILSLLTICLFFHFSSSAYVVLPKNFTTFINNASKEVKKYFFDNQLIAVDYLENSPVSSNCLNASIDNPSLLIYCFVIALIWLATVSTGLFFYFRAIFKRLSRKYSHQEGSELQPLSKNGFDENRKIIIS